MPDGVLALIASDRFRRVTPLRSSVSTSSTKCATERASRPSLMTTRTSPVRTNPRGGGELLVPTLDTCSKHSLAGGQVAAALRGYSMVEVRT
jgi:hypothetical protein